MRARHGVTKPRGWRWSQSRCHWYHGDEAATFPFNCYFQLAGKLRFVKWNSDLWRSSARRGFLELSCMMMEVVVKVGESEAFFEFYFEMMRDREALHCFLKSLGLVLVAVEVSWLFIFEKFLGLNKLRWQSNGSLLLSAPSVSIRQN